MQISFYIVKFHILHACYSSRMIVRIDSLFFYHQGNRTNVGGIRETDEVSQSLREGSPQTSSTSTSHYKAPSGSTDYTSPSSSLTSLCEDADSGI